MSNPTRSFTLNPHLFRPCSAEQKRTKKREAQRKYRRHLQQYPSTKSSSNTRTSRKINNEANTRTSEDVNGDIPVVTQGNPCMPSNDESIPLTNVLDCLTEMAASGNRRQMQQHYRPLLGENHRHNRQSSETSAAVQFPSSQHSQALRAHFEDVFPIENAPIIEGGLAQPLDNHQLHLYPTTLLDLPNDLGRSCYPVGQTLGGSSPQTSQTTPWNDCENATEGPGGNGTLQNSALQGQSIGQSPVIRNSMKDEEPGLNQCISTCVSHSLAYNTFPPTANNLPSPAPSHSVDRQKQPPEAAATPLDSRLVKLSPSSPSATIELQGCTPLFQAVLLGNLKIAAILVARGCNANAVNGAGQTVLHIAARSGNAKMVEYLITCGIDLNFQDNGGNTALHLAVINGHEEIVEMLVNAGAQMDITNN